MDPIKGNPMRGYEPMTFQQTGHVQTGHTFSRIAKITGEAAAVSLVAGAALIAVPVVGFASLPIVTAISVAFGAVALTCLAAGRFFQHLAVRPTALDASDTASHIGELKKEGYKKDLASVIPTLVPVYNDFDRFSSLTLNGLEINYEKKPDRPADMMSDLFNLCDQNPQLTENISCLMTQGESGPGIEEIYKLVPGSIFFKDEKTDPWSVAVKTDGDTIEITHRVGFKLQSDEGVRGPYLMEIVIRANKQELGQNNFQSVTKTFRTYSPQKASG